MVDEFPPNGTYLAQWSPAVSGSRVVWQDYRYGQKTLGPLKVNNWSIWWRDLVTGDVVTSDALVAGEP